MQTRPPRKCLICDFCSSDREFALGLLQIPPHGGPPCPQLTLPTAKRVVDFHHQVTAHSGQTKITDDNGKIIAGCVARMYCWKIAYIDTLWVDEKYRDNGLGSKLLAEVEKTAKDKGCYLIHLDTFDFQAKEFYQKRGYKVFGVLEGCPKSHCRYYLKKTI